MLSFGLTFAIEFQIHEHFLLWSSVSVLLTHFILVVDDSYGNTDIIISQRTFPAVTIMTFDPKGAKFKRKEPKLAEPVFESSTMKNQFCSHPPFCFLTFGRYPPNMYYLLFMGDFGNSYDEVLII